MQTPLNGRDPFEEVDEIHKENCYDNIKRIEEPKVLIQIETSMNRMLAMDLEDRELSTEMEEIKGDELEDR